MKLAIIILSYNTQELTLQCLRSLVQLDDLKVGEDFEIIVVDNASSDGSPEEIAQKHPEVKLIRSTENLGFSRGNNLGVQNISQNTEYVLFLNSDTVVPSGTLSAMLEFMDQRPDVGLASCRVDLWNGNLDRDCHRGFPTPWVALTHLFGLDKLFPRSRWFAGYYQGWKDLNTTHEVDSVVGAFMLVRRQVGDEIGWWDEDYFLNGEDIDFCLRVKKKGYRVVYHPQVAITHYRGASKGTRKESREVSSTSQAARIKVTQAGMDAMRIFYDKHFRPTAPRWKNFLVDAGIQLLRIWRLIRVHI